MKKIVLTMIAAVAMSFNAMAQEQAQNEQRREFNPEEMAKNRTEEAVKKYGLNEEQAVKLLDLNKRFSDKMRPMRNMRQGRPNGGNRERRMERPDSVRREAGQRPDMRGRMEEMRKVQDEYNKELKTILTEEQYQAYEKDEQARRQRFGGQRGQRPPMQRQ